MSHHLKIYSEQYIRSLTRSRENETKIGERVKWITNYPDDLKNCSAKYVLLGLPEDIGVRANFGRGGADTAWKPALENILNLQSNAFFGGDDLLVLGHIDFDDLLNEAASLVDSTATIELRNLVETIDNRVFEVVKDIISLGKIPLVIGGGHNNAYPLIKAAAVNSEEQYVNVVNCDPHTDFRPLEGRHSGNGFSYAYHHHLLNNYAVLGMHESYNTDGVIRFFDQHPDRLLYRTFEDVFIAENYSFEEAMNSCFEFCSGNKCGVELDLDAITNVPSSAKTSSGLSPVQARRFVYQAGKKLDIAYLHIAEGAPVLAHIKADNKTGKLIAYLVADFIKSNKHF